MLSVTCSSLRSAKFDPDEIRSIVRRSKNAGLLHGPGEATPIKKDGKPVAAEAGLRSQWMDVTPGLAKQWLGNNFRNRPISEDVVAAYARDILNGVWIPTHQGIAFNDRDELIDGQHRLHAIVRAGKTVRMMVTFGLPSVIPGKEMTTMDAVDRGRMRSVADQLKIQHGLKNGTAIAGITKIIANICCGERTRRLSVGQSLEIYRAYEQPVEWIVMHRPDEHGLRSMGVLAAFAFAHADETKNHWDGSTPIQLMFGALCKKKQPRTRSPMGLLNAFLKSDDAKLLSRSTDRALAELVLQAIYLETRGRPIDKLELSLDGANHFCELQKDRVAQIAGMFRLPEAVRAA